MLGVTLATLALALPALAPRASLVLNLDTMHVTLDDALPRPTRVLHVNKATTTDFSPPLAAPIAPPPPPTPHWWRYVADHALLAAVGGEGCIPPHCHTAGPFRKGQGATQCAGMCNMTASCAGWNVVKDTATSGQHGKGDLCELYESAGLAKASPFYTADGNFDCGSKSQLQPDPPSGGLHGSRPPQAVPCVAVVAANGTITQFCTDRNEASTAYGSRQTNHSADSVQWKLTLIKTDHGTGRITARLTGRVAIEADPQNANISVLSWSLLSARSDQLEVRAIDLGFAFVGLSGSGDGYYFTSATKTWCPPGVGCGEWRHQTLTRTVGLTAVGLADTTAPEEGPSKTASRFRGGWSPPLPLPWAAQALFDPWRSNGVGGWTANGTAGIGAFSSQLTLPFRRYTGQPVAAVRAAGTMAAHIGFGSARINTNLRCGDILPVHLRFAFFSDITRDGRVDSQDSQVWTRSNYPLAHYLFRGSMTVKIDNDVSSYLPPWNPAPRRVSFNDTLLYVRKIAELAEMPVVMHLVGYAGTGLDTGIYDEINERLGTVEDLKRLKQTAADEYNTLISYHVDTDNAYPNLTACSNATASGMWNDTSGHPVPGTKDGQPTPGFNADLLALDPDGKYWVWDAQSGKMRTDPLQGECYHISKSKSTVSGRRRQQLNAMYNTVPMTGVLHMDAYRDIDVSWETDERGYIAEDEEAACGLMGDLHWLAQHNLSLGVEGANGMASVGGPNSPAMNVFDYYWHGSWSLGEWGRIISGTDQGLDEDMPFQHGCNFTCTINASTDPFANWESLADKIYLLAKPLALQLTDPELLDGSASGVFNSGGSFSTWPDGGKLIEYARAGLTGSVRQPESVFVPAVELPPPGSPKHAPTIVNVTRRYVYLSSKAQQPQTQTWEMPPSWVGKQIHAATITPSGRVEGQPEVSFSQTNLTLPVAPGRPVVLSVQLGA